MNALLDLNIIIDVAINRPGFANDSAPVWKAHVNNQFDGLLAATEITNLFYILSKLIDRETALKTVNMCLKDFQIVSLGHAELSTAAKMPGKDFEDNVVIACAELVAADYIITRDATGFVHSTVPAIAPADFIALLGS